MAVDFQAGQFQIVGFAVVGVGDFGRNVAERGREGIVHDVVAAFDAVVVDGGFAAVERILRRTGFHQPADIIDALAVGDFQAGGEFAVGGGQLPRQGEQVEDLSGDVFGLQFAAFAVGDFAAAEFGFGIGFAFADVFVIARVQAVAVDGAAAFEAEVVHRHFDDGNDAVVVAAAAERHGCRNAVRAAVLQFRALRQFGCRGGQCGGQECQRGGQ